MNEDAYVPSLLARIRALEDILAGLDGRVEQSLALGEEAAARARDAARLVQLATRLEDASTAGARYAPRHRHRAARDRHGLRVIPGGMAAALAPVAMAAHCPLMLAVPGLLRGAARVLRSHWAMMAAAVVLVGFGAAAVGVPAADFGVPPPYVRALVHRHACYRPDADADADRGAPVPGTRWP